MSFTSELTAIGGHVFEAPDIRAARDYIEKLISSRPGPAIAAQRSTVERLGLRGIEFHGERSIAEAGIGITQADYGLDDTGTLVVFSESGEGRSLSLLPPLHIAVLEKWRIVGGLDALFAREPDFALRSSAMILITGPSRTADIEKTLTVGVHGPGELHVVILP